MGMTVGQVYPWRGPFYEKPPMTNKESFVGMNKNFYRDAQALYAAGRITLAQRDKESMECLHEACRFASMTDEQVDALCNR